ncbi:MAG: hypothetical protein E6G13_00100, partial [Actinobacteria bacterium]
MAALNAFSTSGRLSVIVRTPPSRLVSTSATAGLSQIAHPRDAREERRREGPGETGRGAAPSASAATSTAGTIVFTSTRDGNEEIYAASADGSNQRNLTQNASADRQPALSPDVTRVAFVSDRDGRQDTAGRDEPPGRLPTDEVAARRS